MIGSVIGVVCGLLIYLSLSRLSLSVTQKGKVSVPYLLLAILTPVIGLLFCAVVLRDELVFAGIGIAASLVVAALINFAIHCFSKNHKS